MLVSKEIRMARNAMALASVLALAACGGGGGGGSDSGPDASATTSISGVASKGLLANALVDVYSVTSAGAADKLLGHTTTDANGHYVISGLTPGQLVLIKVSAQSGTTMKDEATGQTLTLAANALTLTAATTLDSTGSTTAHVTPFSEMAYQAAKAQIGAGTFTPGLVQAANNQVSASLGVSILSDTPAFDSNNKPTNAAAVKLAAVSQIAKDGAISGCAAPASSSDADIASSVACVVGKLSAAGASTSTVTKDAVTTALNNEQARVDKSAVTDSVELNKATALVTTPPTTITVATNEQLTLVGQAKALIKSLRNTFSSLSADKTTNGSLQQKLNTVANEVDATVAAVDPSTVRAFSSIANALSVMNGESGAPDNTGAFYVTSNGFVGSYETSGKCQYFTAADFVTKSSSATGYLRCRIMQGKTPVGTVVSSTYPVVAVQTQVKLIRVSQAAAASQSDQYTVISSLIKQSGSYDDQAGLFTPDANSAVTSITGGAVTEYTATASRVSNGQDPLWPNDPTDIAYNNFKLIGNIAPGVDRALTASRGAYQYVDVEMGSTATGDATANTKVALVGEFDVYSGTNVLMSAVKVKPGSYLQSNARTAGVPTAAASSTGANAHVVFEATAQSGSKLVGSLDASNFVDLLTYAVPRTGTFKGTLTDASGAVLFDGTLVYGLNPLTSASTSNDVSWASVDLTGTLWIGAGNSLTTHVHVTKDASTAVETFSGSYTQTDGAAFLIAGTWHDSDVSQQVLHFSTASGIHFDATPSATTANITNSNGTVVGAVIDFDAAKVSYADYSYEQF